MSRPVWRCAKCGREQGEDIEQPCECGSTVFANHAPPKIFWKWERTATGWNLFHSTMNGPWIFERHIDRDEEPEEPTALDYCPKPNTP